ncbi:hypothetical protein DPMN_058609 [Dreissena polymorpha]|uniref:Uncharacterized protein n=1 Tax=Dreissena polymorpha TaxID=45954 RepID=A0A9D4HFN2_DREPO|nr:hypothetical protein DPMN_058609 [Dreissena polymorpha]
MQQELKSPGSNVRSQRKHPNASEHCSFKSNDPSLQMFDPLAYTEELPNLSSFFIIFYRVHRDCLPYGHQPQKDVFSWLRGIVQNTGDTQFQRFPWVF